MNPLDPQINILLQNGFGKPRLLNNLLYFEKISNQPFLYLRDTVIPNYNNNIIRFSENAISRLKTLLQSKNEWYGVFAQDRNGDLIVLMTKQGNYFSVIPTNNIYKYSFHTHPIVKNIPYSFFSVEDIIFYYISTKISNEKTLKYFLIIENGILSIQLTNDCLEIDLEIIKKIYMFMFKNILVKPNTLYENLHFLIYESVDFLNRLNGKILADLCTEYELLEIDQYEKLQNYLEFNNLFYVNYMEWDLINVYGYTDYQWILQN